MPKKLFTRRRFALALSSGAVCALLLVLCAFAVPHQLLCIDDGDANGDALVVLGGGSYERPVRAAELYRDHVAPRIIITGFGDYETNRRMLLRHGVPANAITIEPKATTTRENALFTIPLLREMGAKRVILVTSWYHSRRSLRCFRHYAPDIEFYSRPAYFAYARNEWRIQGTYRYIRGEYLKLAGYWFRFGICPI